MALRLDFGMTSGVEIGPSRKLFQFCILWLASRMPQWRIILEVTSGSYQWNLSFIIVAHDWGWKSLLHYSICCIPLERAGR
jgi:hypothetical protein